MPETRPDFELLSCKNAYKTSADLNETFKTYVLFANASKNDIKVWIGQQRRAVGLYLSSGGCYIQELACIEREQ